MDQPTSREWANALGMKKNEGRRNDFLPGSFVFVSKYKCVGIHRAAGAVERLLSCSLAFPFEIGWLRDGEAESAILNS